MNLVIDPYGRTTVLLTDLVRCHSKVEGTYNMPRIQRLLHQSMSVPGSKIAGSLLRSSRVTGVRFCATARAIWNGSSHAQILDRRRHDTLIRHRMPQKASTCSAAAALPQHHTLRGLIQLLLFLTVHDRHVWAARDAAVCSLRHLKHLQEIAQEHTSLLVARDLRVERIHEIDLWQEDEVTRLGMHLGRRLLGTRERGLIHAHLGECDADAFQLRAGQA